MCGISNEIKRCTLFTNHLNNNFVAVRNLWRICHGRSAIIISSWSCAIIDQITCDINSNNWIYWFVASGSLAQIVHWIAIESEYKTMFRLYNPDEFNHCSSTKRNTKATIDNEIYQNQNAVRCTEVSLHRSHYFHTNFTVSIALRCCEDCAANIAWWNELGYLHFHTKIECSLRMHIQQHGSTDSNSFSS